MVFNVTAYIKYDIKMIDEWIIHTKHPQKIYEQTHNALSRKRQGVCHTLASDLMK